MHRSLADLPEPGPGLAVCLRDLAQAADPRTRMDRVEAAALLLIQALGQAGLTASRDAFLLAHARELRRGLDPALLAMNPRLEG